MGDFGVDTAVKGADGRYQASLSPEWEIWGPNGGYVATIALRAAGAESRSEWLFIEATAPVGADGLVGFHSRVWSETGVLLASGGGQLLCRPL